MTKRERLARAGHDRMFEERWDDLHPESIDRALWLAVIDAILAELRPEPDDPMLIPAQEMVQECREHDKTGDVIAYHAVTAAIDSIREE